MSAFTPGFNFGFAGGMFNNMFSGFNMPCCFNFTPTFFTPMMNSNIFTPYTQQMPSFNMPLFNSMPAFNYGFSPMAFSNWDTFTRTTSESNSNSSAGKTRTSKHYSKMSDSEMLRIYGNYTKKITDKYNGTAADLNKQLSNRGVLKGKGQAFIDAQNKYGISAAVLAAICIWETGGTKGNAVNGKNNVSNISEGKGWRNFSSVEECINHTAKLLKENYVEEGLVSLYQVNAKYCPVADTRASAASQSSWAKHINNINNQIERA